MARTAPENQDTAPAGPRRAGGFARVLGPLLAAAVAACLAEAVIAARAASVADVGVGGQLFGLYLTFGLLACLALPLVLVAALVIARPAVRRLVRGLRDALGGEDPLSPGRDSVALLCGMLALALAAAGGAAVGLWANQAMSPTFAVVATVLGTLLALGLALPLAGVLSTPLGRLLVRAARHNAGRIAVALPWTVLVLDVFLLVLLLRFLPAGYAVAPVVAVAALALAITPSAQRVLGRILRGWRAAVVPLVLLVASAPAYLLADRASPGLQETLLFRPPYLSFTLGVVHKLLDADRDGYAAVLMGRDCNDHDAAINPGAKEILQNGIDEDCNGLDAQPFVRAAQPEYPRPAALPDKPNVVLILLEALRPERLGFNGYKRQLTPNLDRFREQATWFAHAYTPAPTTRFAMASLFTGLDPPSLPHEDLGKNRFRLLPEATTMAELLSQAGYDTYGLTISYVIHHNKGSGQGFREWKTPWPTGDWRKAYGKAAKITTDDAIGYLAKSRASKKPFLLYLHYRFCHDPYIKHDEWDFGSADTDRYDSALAYGDRQLGRLLEVLRRDPRYGRTAVFIFSDHGEMFGEHGLTNHGNSLYENDVRVVLMARLPLPTQRTVVAPVILTDIAPTVLQLAGVKTPKGLDGWSLLPLFFEPLPPPPWGERPLFLFTDVWRGTVRNYLAAALRWPHKAIRNRVTGRRFLFDVADDPAEKNDLMESQPELATGLHGLLESWLAKPSGERKKPKKPKKAKPPRKKPPKKAKAAPKKPAKPKGDAGKKTKPEPRPKRPRPSAPLGPRRSSK